MRGTPSDAEVVALVLAGDTEAFGFVIRRYEAGLLRFATRMLGSRDAAADAGWRRAPDPRHHARLEARARLGGRRHKEISGGGDLRRDPPQLFRERLGGQLAVQHLMNSRIDRVHAYSSSTFSSASRARCTRILSVGMRSPVAAAISS